MLSSRFFCSYSMNGYCSLVYDNDCSWNL